MDPSANLLEQRELAQQIIRGSDEDRLDSMLDAAERLAELVIALDEWRLHGGFDPYA
jgi:hypothetical protein